MKHVFTLLCLLSLNLSAQYETINWAVPGTTLLNFTTTPAGVSNTLPMISGGMGSSVSDASGNLKVVTNSGLVYNAQGQLVAPQNTTVPAGTGDQSGLVVPMPGSPGIYYVFFIGGYNVTSNLAYSIFNPTLSAGAGSLTVMNATVNTLNTNNGLCAIRHCNGKDVWVVCAQDTSITLPSYNVYSYLVTAAGITTVPVISSVNNLSDPSTHGIAYLRSSPDGRKLVISARKDFIYPSTYSVVVSDFNRTTGTLNNTYLARKFNSTSPSPSSIEFSPDGSKLYIVEAPRNIVQLDFCAGTPTAVVASANTVVALPAVSTYSFYRGIQRAINGYIYLGKWTPQGFTDSLAAITQPNSAGSACNFSLNVQSVGTGTYIGYLPHYPHYLMKPLITLNQPYPACSKIIFNGPSTVCATVSGSLSTFYWDFGDLASTSNTSTAYSPSHNYDNSGTYHVKLILDDGQCVADTLYKTVTITTPTVNITLSPLSQTICAGQSTTLTASGASGYTWMPGSLSGSQVAVSLQMNTTYTVTGADNAGCENKSLASVSVYPVSTLTVNTNPKTICAGRTITLTASGALSYTWNTGVQSQSLSVTPANTTVYTITSIDSYSCSKMSAYTLNVINCTGLSDLNENKNLFDIYPNPATKSVNIEWQSMNEGPLRIEIVNSLGQIIYSTQNKTLSGEKSNSHQIDLSGTSRGIYFIKMTTGENYAIRKLVLE